ncbi:MAG: transcription termination/antitermination NusG family protein [Pseudomonadota bacterium]
MNRWYAVNTQPHQENKAQFNLVRQGYEAWLPLRRKTRRHARRIETIKAALFPNYLFVRLDLSCERWRPINGTFGVRQLVMRGDGPAPVADGFVEDLRATVDGEDCAAAAPNALRVGDAVRILGGPFGDAIGSLVELRDSERVAVLLNLLGRDVRAAVPRHAVAPA